MKALIQRVLEARVTVEKSVVGEIDAGLLVLLGFDRGDGADLLDRMIEKLLAYRLFADDEGRMNRSLRDTGGGILVVSQFTLSADTGRGLRPSFTSALPPAEAEELYDEFMRRLNERYSPVAAGRFGADMQVSSINNGPVTFMLEIPPS